MPQCENCHECAAQRFDGVRYLCASCWQNEHPLMLSLDEQMQMRMSDDVLLDGLTDPTGQVADRLKAERAKRAKQEQAG